MRAGGCRSGGLWERFNGGVGGDSGGVEDLWMVRMWHSSSEEGIWGLQRDKNENKRCLNTTSGG